MLKLNYVGWDGQDGEIYILGIEPKLTGFNGAKEKRSRNVKLVKKIDE